MAANLLARGPLQELPHLAPLEARCRRSSFIKEVMEQVKRDMESNEALKKDWQKVQESSKKVEEHATQVGGAFSSASSKTSDILDEWKRKAAESQDKVAQQFQSASEQNESVKKAQEALRDASAGSQVLFAKTKGAFNGLVDSASGMFGKLGEDKTERTKQWKAARDAAQAHKDAADEATAGSTEAAGESAHTSTANMAEPADQLVVSQERTSSWDRFGAGLRDMPFLNSVFENPLFDQLFGESEIAASIREMKTIDYYFELEEFAEDVEHVVAPHIIKSYLEGDQDALQMHCGEAAFAAVNASIKSRKQQKMTLDTHILAGPKDVELKGAKLMEQGAPCFIWTFNMQQVNCLRDRHGEIIEGAVDDIRTVCYALAVTRHPEVESTPELEYPWQVSEMAILWNQPCF